MYETRIEEQKRIRVKRIEERNKISPIRKQLVNVVTCRGNVISLSVSLFLSLYFRIESEIIKYE